MCCSRVNRKNKQKTNTHKSRNRKSYIDSNGKWYKYKEGSRRQVWTGFAYQTGGKLTRSHLIKNRRGRIVSKCKSEMSKYSWKKGTNPLVKAGYIPKFGTFILFKKHIPNKPNIITKPYIFNMPNGKIKCTHQASAPTAPVVVVPTVCSWCDTEFNQHGGYRCSRCKRAHYCDQKCQRKDWKSHKLVCMPPRPPAALPNAAEMIKQ